MLNGYPVPNLVQISHTDPPELLQGIEECQLEIGAHGPNTDDLHDRTVVETAGNRRRNRFAERICHTMRSGFYADTHLFRGQSDADRAMNEVCVRLDCTRDSTCVFGENRGYVIGGLRFNIQGDGLIDCNTERGDLVKCRVGQQIPPFMDTVINIVGDADLVFILFVEKYSAFIELAQFNFHNRYHCIIVTGKGQSDLATRSFLRRLTNELRLPIFCLVDCDVAGLEIFILMKYGSTNMAYDSKNLSCPQMYYLGVLPSDLDRFDIPSENLTMTERARIQMLCTLPCLIEDPTLELEAGTMHLQPVKTSIEMLNTISPHCMSRNYVPLKLFLMMDDLMHQD